MISFDNGPADGDYVRYIDDLTRNAAIAASAGVLTDDDVLGGVGRRNRLAVSPVKRADVDNPTASSEWTPATAGGAPRTMQESSRTTGFGAPVAATPTATAAAAIASALMSGQVGNRPALASHAKVGLGTIVFGLLLLLVGFLWQPLNVLVMAAGGALIAWAIRMLRDASLRSSSVRG